MDGTEYIEKCPICGNETLHTWINEEDLNYFGKINIFTSLCYTCGFRHVDVIFLENRGHVKITFVASGEEDLKVRVIRSSSASIYVNEIGVSIEPVMDGESFVSNVEGLLFRILGIMKQLLRDGDDNTRSLIYEKMKKIARMRHGKDKLTIIIDDPTGNSAILSEKAVIEYYENKK
ncbi:MAG: ZPR1 zinc finger domain-containing protein [Thermoplasmata archaeon]